jgi:hypothetical protein
MDPTRFDTLVRAFAAGGTRRRLLAVLSALPLGGLLALDEDEVGAERPHKRMHRRNQQRKSKQRNRHKHNNTHRRKKDKKKGGKGGAAPLCSSTTCPEGCCDTNGVCQPGTSDGACGANGQFCGFCLFGQHCVGNQCVCDGQTCPDGCCANGPGQPGQCLTGDPGFCGTGGVHCSYPNGTTCTQDDQCCSGNCVGIGVLEEVTITRTCADRVTQCDDETFCDPPAKGCAGDSICCNQDYICGDTCCAPEFGMCCGDNCCTAGNHCCDAQFKDVCCPPDNQCCGDDTCCSDAESCCGDMCCTSDQQCCQTCFGPECCPKDWQCCCAINNQATVACCPPGTTCCGSECCAAGVECQLDLECISN